MSGLTENIPFLNLSSPGAFFLAFSCILHFFHILSCLALTLESSCNLVAVEKAEEPEIKWPTTKFPSWKKEESSRKTFISALLTMPKPLTVWITITVENSERDGNTRPPDLPLEKFYADQEATVRNGHGTTDLFQIGKGVRQGGILSPCLFNL